MAKKVKKKKKKITPIFFILIVIIITAGVYIMFFAMPEGDAIKSTMEKEDFQITSDVNTDTPLLGALLPENANRTIIFNKNLNGKIYTVIVTYFNNYQSAKTYYDSLEENENETDAAYIRGNSVIMGSKDEVKTLRWKIWAFSQ